MSDGVDNLLNGIPKELPEEWIEVLVSAAGVRLERIVSRGHCSAAGFWYQQDQAEWVLLVQGRAELRFEEEGRSVVLKAGDHLRIPAGCRHRVEWTSSDPEAVWLALFYSQQTGG